MEKTSFHIILEARFEMIISLFNKQMFPQLLWSDFQKGSEVVNDNTLELEKLIDTQVQKKMLN